MSSRGGEGKALPWCPCEHREKFPSLVSMWAQAMFVVSGGCWAAGGERLGQMQLRLVFKSEYFSALV